MEDESATDSNHPVSELDDWNAPTTSTCSGLPQKIAVSTSRLFLLAVEYADPTLDYGRSAFSTFEPGAPFSPQPSSSSLSEFEQRVSPLDPNLSSAARYSPVYGSLNSVANVEELQLATGCDSYNVATTASPGSTPLIHQYHNLPEGEELKTPDEGEGEEEAVGQVLANIAYTLEPSAIFPTSDELNIVSFDGDMNAMKGSHGVISNYVMDMLLVDPYPDPTATYSPTRVSKRQLQAAQSELDRCGECSYETGCESHQVQSIADKPVPLRSWATLPASYLAISKPANAKEGECGVFARKTIPKRTQFGPIEGILNKDTDCPDSDSNSRVVSLLVEEETGVMLRLDTSDENCSNWMRYVRAASNEKEQNLVLSQQGHSLYFTTSRVIHPRQELMVWYSQSYAKKRGLPVLHLDAACEGESSWPCFECNQQFASSDHLQKHLNIHENERESAENITKVKSKKNYRPLKRKVRFLTKKYNQPMMAIADSTSEKSVYQCKTCNRLFPRNYSLKRHQLSHLAKIVQTKQVEEVQIQPHLGEWQCTACWLTFDSPTVLNLHTLAHAAEDVETNASNVQRGTLLQCPQCSAQFPTQRALIQHVADHAKARPRLRGALNPAKPCKCDLCYKSFATDDRLQRHMLVHGTDESKPLQCDVCFKRFLNNSALACHVKIHSEKKLFECPICKAMYCQVLALKEHVHSHASNGLFLCPQCGKSFDEYSLIRKHIRAFHSDRKHTCSYCTKLFPTLDKLRMHMLRHSDHREFLCANCGKQFKRKDKLKEHMTRMHSVEREMRLATKPHRNSQVAKKFMPKVQVSPTDYHRFIYKCHTCLLGFKRRGMLVNHLAKRHPDISPESVPELNLPILKTTRDYYCQYCEKVYKSSSKRKAHILKNHPGAELPMSNRRKGGVPEIPGVPNPTFSQTVGSITTCPHGCPWCHKQYASKAKLLQHQRKKHTTLLPTTNQVSRGSPESVKFHTDKDEKNPVSISILANADFHIASSEELTQEIESGSLKRPIKLLGETDLLSEAMSELNSLGEFRVSADQYQQLLASTENFTPYTAR